MPRARLSVTPTQRLRLTAGLHSAIHMLRADANGLTRYLEEQAEANPYLRLDPAPAPGPADWLPRWTGVIGGAAAGGSQGGGHDDPHAGPYAGPYAGANGGLHGGSHGGAQGALSGVALAIDLAEVPAASLLAHVMGVVDRMQLAPRAARIAAALVEALEPSGWLGKPLPNIAQDVGVPLAEVAPVLTRLQRIEPAGLFARNLAECLELQLAEQAPPDAIMRVILGRLDLLGAGDHARLARLAQTTPAEIAVRFRIIRALDPKPGAQFAPLAAAALRDPDLLVRQTAAGDWDVSLNRSCLPTVSVRRPDTGRGGASLAAARAVALLVENRNDTLLRVGREILARQHAALDRGPAALVALTMAEVAAALDLHESTVSRIVAGASVDTPRGTWWLRRLFSARLGDGAGATSGAAVRARLAALVGAEPKDAPLSDAALATALTQGGAAVARRTVAKYRAALGIPPAARRRRHKKPKGGA